jgi:hypothetical protein
LIGTSLPWLPSLTLIMVLQNWVSDIIGHLEALPEPIQMTLGLALFKIGDDLAVQFLYPCGNLRFNVTSGWFPFKDPAHVRRCGRIIDSQFRQGAAVCTCEWLINSRLSIPEDGNDS